MIHPAIDDSTPAGLPERPEDVGLRRQGTPPRQAIEKEKFTTSERTEIIRIALPTSKDMECTEAFKQY